MPGTVHPNQAWQVLRDQAPTIPGDTCPTIDAIKLRLSAIENDLAILIAEVTATRLKQETKESIIDGMHDIDRTLAGVNLRLEELRTDNEQLRESGRYWYGIAKEAHTGEKPKDYLATWEQSEYG